MSPERQPPFTTIHGIDGTGKSATVQHLTNLLIDTGYNALNYEAYAKANVENPISKIKRRMIEIGTPEAQFLLFLTSTFFHSEIIRQLRLQGQTIVKDRWIWDVQAHHEHLGVRNTDKIIKGIHILKPDLAVVLTLEETERKKRILQRGILDTKDTDNNQPGTRAHFFERFLLQEVKKLRGSGQGLIIDTTHVSPEEVARIILNHMHDQQLSHN